MKKRTLFLGLASVLILSLTYWSWKQLKFAPVSESVLNLSLDNAVESLDPAKAFSDDSLVVSAQVMEPLYQYHYLKRPYEIQPLLAEGLPQFSENGTKITIKIKKKVFYHPHPAFKNEPREMIAEDFVNQFKRLALDSLKSPGRSIFANIVSGFEGYGSLVNDNWKEIHVSALQGVEASDRYTLKITLTKAEPNIIFYLALNFIVPVPWEVIEHEQNKLDHIMVGTGPYLLRSASPEFFELKKNPHYREDFYPTSGDRYANIQKLLDSSKEKIPFIDVVRFHQTHEADRWKKFFDHELDLLSVPKTFIPELYNTNGELSDTLKDQGILLKQFPILANRWFAFNMRDPILGKNKDLRKAIAYSIDYQKYIQMMSQNTNLRANSILVPGISGYLPTQELRYSYDKEKALDHYAKAGYKDPSKMPVIRYSTRGVQPIHIMEAEFIRDQLSPFGIKVEIEKLEFSDFLRKGRAGELMFFTDNWLFDYPEGENIIQLLVSGNFPGVNKSAYSNPDVDRLYASLKTTFNHEMREKVFHEIDEIIWEELPWIPMMYESSFVLQYPEIKNFRKSSIIRNYVKYLKITK